MDELNKINISISSWPGSGATTLALILANLTKRKYINLGNVFRYLGENMGFSNEGISRPEFDNYIENIIGTTIDNFVDYKLLNDNNLIVEADISVFRIGKHPKIFSIFLKATKEERIKRVLSDNRDDAIIALEKRDEILKQKYYELWHVDFFDEEFIQKKYNMLFDNSNMALNNEVKQIVLAFKEYLQYKSIPETYWTEIESKIDYYVDLYNKKGKSYLNELLEKENLGSNAKEIMLEITRQFPEDIETFSQSIKNLFLGINKKS